MKIRMVGLGILIAHTIFLTVALTMKILTPAPAHAGSGSRQVQFIVKKIFLGGRMVVAPIRPVHLGLKQIEGEKIETGRGDVLDCKWENRLAGFVRDDPTQKFTFVALKCKDEAVFQLDQIYLKR